MTGAIALQSALYLLAALVTVEQVFDVISTNLVLSKGRGHEGNGFIASIMGQMGKWWWIVKLPAVAFAWALSVMVVQRYSVAVLLVIALVYAYVIFNNYQIAWRKI